MKRASFIILILLVCIGLTAASLNQAKVISDSASNRNNLGPFNLMAGIVNVNDVLLVWQNPDFLNEPLGFRIYCNDCMVRFIPGTDIADYLLENVCGGCHQFYVAAYFDTGCESEPSNVAEITVTSNSDNYQPVNQMALKVYPNPSRGSVNVKLSGTRNNNIVAVKVYNALGELVRQSDAQKDNEWLWDGKDIRGKSVSEGIYLMRVITTQGILTQKFIRLK